MNFNSICSISFLLLLLDQSAAANEDYFKKSIFNALKDDDAQFRSEIAFESESFAINLTEKYNFELNTGQTTRYITRFRSKYFDANYVCLYVNHANLSELHDYDQYSKYKYCHSTSFTRTNIHYLLRALSMNFLLKLDVDFKVLGKCV